MGKHNHHLHHQPQISSFNLAYCLMPLTAKETSSKRFTEDATTASSSSSRHRRHDSDEPSSPRVSCMGYIKKEKATLPWKSPVTARSSSSKLLRLGSLVFSGKGTITSPRPRRKVADDGGGAGLSVENMDPPLPVAKGVMKMESSESLWKRRCGGNALHGLQLEKSVCEFRIST